MPSPSPTASRSSPAPRAASATPARSRSRQAGAHVVAVARTVGGLEELDDAIEPAGGTATLVPLDLKDYAGIDRLAAALNERYGRLDMLVGNAGILGAAVAARSCRAERLGRRDRGQRHRQLAADPRVRRSAEGIRRRPRGVPHFGRRLAMRAPTGAPMRSTKAALDTLVRTYAAETATTKVRVNLSQSRARSAPACSRPRCRGSTCRRSKSPRRSRRRSLRCAART